MEMEIDQPLQPRTKSPGKTVLVTGGSGGIGRGLCVAFARAGHWVGVHYGRHASAAQETLDLLRAAGGAGALYQADIRRADEVQTMVAAIETARGKLDILICNAGTAGSHLVVTCPETEWQRVVDTNLTGTFHCLQAAGAAMSAGGGGSIVLIGSYAGLQGATGQAAYAASKAGLIGLMKSVAREWGPHNIRVNLVCPGWQATPLAGDRFPAQALNTDHVLGRTSNLDEVTKMVCMLAEVSDISGQVWNLDSRVLP
ncbi:SDR family oxidoreductase [Nitrospirales bacterium NOB]|nr:MAG: 3-oxoacyl-ACP reductase [Nitrospira sp. OLB3]MBV6469430.1 3-oxoacyl-[acyl-carrier-protein] reductase FabG [Nitrospirota bacterium]MCE7965077.1 SDR family oxidoreductase [Nitrospira sp. NTP2]MCK6493711.1 SDR family oxidoreductase [Nitrospira sp.]MDL1889615.1 SDR family oxidoreductase [Nitrospirales bacterium NOB]MEB2337675.1 SDR family NAD(P)-dependent oxidoreductase [Nitrospirales bacterium]